MFYLMMYSVETCIGFYSTTLGRTLQGSTLFMNSDAFAEALDRSFNWST
jgi:hypothetical protein